MSTPDAARGNQLCDILGSYRAVASGHLRLLSLDALRARMGAKWQTRSDHVQFIVESVIKRHLQRGQTFYQANDSAFVIVFDFDAQDRAEFVCRAISREIVQRLLGASENKADELAVEMRVAVVSCDQIRHGGDIAAALEKSLADAPPQVIADGEDGRNTSQMSSPARVPELSPAQPTDGSAEVTETQPLHRTLRNLLETAEERLLAGGNPQTGVPAPANSPTLGFLYLPFWNVRTRAFLAYRIDPRIRLEGHGVIGSDTLQDKIDDAELIRTVDRLSLNQSLLDLARSLETKRKYVAVVPLHVESLARETDRSSLLELLESQPDPIPRLIAIEIVDSPRCRWLDLVRYLWILRDKCRHVIIRQAMSSVPRLQSQHLPDGSVGMSVVLPNSKVPEEQIVRGMNGFIEAVAKHRIETYVYGLRSRSLAFAAIGAGFDHVSGPAIAARSSGPSGVALAAMDEVFQAKSE